MGFWIFMFVCNLLVPLVILGFGKVFIKHPPKDINGVYGYRSSMSMKNQETWDFAHHYCGRLWIKIGWIILIISIIPMMFVIGKADNIIGIMSLIICGIQLVVLIGTIISTEKALNKNFHKDGTKKIG